MKAKKANIVKMATVNVAEAGENNEVAKLTRQLYDSVMSNLKEVGNKYFVCIEKELLFADPKFQRLNKAGGIKVNTLAVKWNPNKCDPIRVSPHDEECRFSIIDGLHRFLAAQEVGEKRLVCEVIMNLPKNPEERLKAEAFLFATQNDEVDTLAPAEKHHANMIMGIPEYITLDKIAKKYGIAIKAGAGRGLTKSNVLAGYVEAVNMVRIHGETVADAVFRIICESRWNLCPAGTGNKALRCLKNVIVCHPGYEKEIIEKTVARLKTVTPSQFMAEAISAYPERKESEQPTLYLEDYLCEVIGMDRLYLADKGIKRNNVALQDLSAS